VQSIRFSCILLQVRGFPDEKLFFVVAPNIVNIIIAVPPIHTKRCIISHAPSRKRQIAVSFTGYFGTGGFLLPVGHLGSGGGFCVYGKFVEPCFKNTHFLNSSLNCQEGMFRIQHFRGGGGSRPPPSLHPCAPSPIRKGKCWHFPRSEENNGTKNDDMIVLF
jgi:hypothetical protein